MTTGFNTMTDDINAKGAWRIETRTKLSGLFSIAAIAVVVLMAAAPFAVSRGVVQDLFFILTMLTLAQSWNLLAGYAGLISVGQQLFVGCGAYALFGLVILAGVDPLIAIPLAGLPTRRARRSSSSVDSGMSEKSFCGSGICLTFLAARLPSTDDPDHSLAHSQV